MRILLRTLVALLITLTLLTLTLAGCTWTVQPPATSEVTPQSPPPPAPLDGPTGVPTDESTDESPDERATVPAPAPLTTPASTPASLSGEVSAHLAAALAYAPAVTQLFAFTDWTVLKREAGVPELTSAASMDARLDFMLEVGVQEQAVASAFGGDRFVTHADTWGWDSTDLLWEANLTLDGPPVWVLRFRDDFNFAPVLALLEERDYVTSTHTGVEIYSHELDLTTDWLRRSEFGILNIAFLEGEKSFILSSSPDMVIATLDAIAAGQTMAAQRVVLSVAAQLGDAGAALIAPDGCSLVDIATRAIVTPDAAATLQRTLDATGIRYPFSYFGFSYVVEGVEDAATGADEELPLGIFVYHYMDVALAEADLEPRRRVAVTGNLLARDTPHAELFEVVDAEVVPDTVAETTSAAGGANLVLRLHALDRAPQIFITLIYQRDLLFSVCGGG